MRIDGVAVPLPRSRKTRALLAYLAMTGRAHRRDPLCTLLWDVTDDRRAALRWSLSKLRATLGATAERHLIATRDTVELKLTEEHLDLARLRSALRSSSGAASHDRVAGLESLVEGWNGELVEGLLLPDFDGFEAWLEAERMEGRALHLRARRYLTEQRGDDPARAFAHARAWAQAGGGAEAQAWLDRLQGRLSNTVRDHDEDTADSGARSDERPPAPMRSADAPTPPLCGRTREMARLRRLVEATRAGRRGHVALVLGDAGLGKTRLLEELRHLERATSPGALAVEFHEGEQGRPLGAFLDALSGAPALLGDDSDRESCFEAIASHVRREAERDGLGLVILDDAHLADASSCELIHFIVRTAARVPLLTVIAVRTAEWVENEALLRTINALRQRHPVEELRLGPLDETATRMLVSQVARASAVEPVVQQSGGVPLIALALAHHPAPNEGIPPTLADLVSARLSQLTTPAQSLVQWAAVLEQGPLTMLEQVSGGDAASFVEAVEMATRYELIRVDSPEGGRPRFRAGHALVRQAIYERISAIRRAAMHRAIAEVVSHAHPSEAMTTLLAHHASRADDPVLAAHALIRAGARAAAMGATLEALALADRSLEFIRRLDPTEALSLEIEAIALTLQLRRPAAPGEAVRRLTQLGLAAVGLGRTELASHAFQAAGRLRWDTGSEHEGYRDARQAWRASAGGTAVQRVRGSSMLALCLVLMEKDLAEAHALVVEAEALVCNDKPAELALARAQLHVHAGNLEDARRDLEDARTLARLEGQALRESASLGLGVRLEFLAGAPARAVVLAHELQALATRIREGSEGPFATAALALAEPDLEAAREVLAPVVERLHVLDDKRTIAWVLNRWARRERTEGHASVAAGLAQRALEAALAVQARSEAAVSASELMASAHMRGDDQAYAAGEAKFVELETQGSLSFEARTAIEAVTGDAGRLSSPSP